MRVEFETSKEMEIWSQLHQIMVR